MTNFIRAISVVLPVLAVVACADDDDERTSSSTRFPTEPDDRDDRNGGSGAKSPGSNRGSGACEEHYTYSNYQSAACGACLQQDCSREYETYIELARTSCNAEYTREGPCTTCECSRNALTQASCRDGFENLVACLVAECSRPCR